MVDETVVELQAEELGKLLRGERGSVRTTVSPDAPQSTPIAETALNETYTLTGVIRSLSDINTFQRDDGTEGQVRNVRIQDRTGDIRASLWGDWADLEMSVGDYLHLFGAEVDTGYEDQKEASVGYDGTAKVIPYDEIDTERFVTITTTS